MRKADLRDFIDKVFIDTNPRPHEIHKTIVTLGPDSYITTNYDRLIEDAYQQAHSGFVLAPVNNDQLVEQARIMKHGASRFIFTPHGRADHVESIILSREDYRRVQFGSSQITSSLEHLFLSRPVVYVGFGLRDPDFLMIKDQIASTYKGAERGHIAIVPDASEMIRDFWRENYGIHVVPYGTRDVESTDSSGNTRKGKGHDQLLTLLNAAKAEINRAGASVDAASGSAGLADDREADALIRFCEDLEHSLGSTLLGLDISIEAQFRPDLTQKEVTRTILQSRLPVSKLLDSGLSLLILGSPGSGKTHAIQAYARLLASRALPVLRSGHPLATLRHTIPLILPMKEYAGDIEGDGYGAIAS
jgi:hypothetical protein